MKGLSIKRAAKSDVYKHIVEGCCRQLELSHTFAKGKILKETGYDVIDDINWDIVRRLIEDRLDTQLIPLAGSFFKGYDWYTEDDDIVPKKINPRVLARRYPNRYIAQGHGKKTAGYAIATVDNSHFVIEVANTKRARAIGTSKAADRVLTIGQREHIPELEKLSPLIDKTAMEIEEKRVEEENQRILKKAIPELDPAPGTRAQD